jgi:hypothetical protein
MSIDFNTQKLLKKINPKIDTERDVFVTEDKAGVRVFVRGIDVTYPNVSGNESRAQLGGFGETETEASEDLFQTLQRPERFAALMGSPEPKKAKLTVLTQG